MGKLDPSIQAAIIVVFGAIVQAVGIIGEVRKIIEEIRRWKGILRGLFAFLLTLLSLLIPEGLILFFVLPVVIENATGYTWDQYIVKQSIAWSSAFIGSIYPFLWAIIFPQIRQKVTQNNVQSEGDKL